MLYDSKWQTKADPFLLSTLLVWLETREPDEKYNYTNPADCLLCRYFADHGWKQPLVDYSGVYEGEFDKVGQPYPVAFWKIAGPGANIWTMGAALKRAQQWNKTNE